MRFKAVISLCKKAKQVILCDHKGVQWIGDGKSAGLGELKYICVYEKSPTGRIHFHLILSGGVDIRTLSSMWGMGIISAAPLEFNEKGIADLVNYITKNSGKNERRVSTSRNLKKPVEKITDGRIMSKPATKTNGGRLSSSCRPLSTSGEPSR